MSEEIAVMVRDARREPEPDAEAKRRMWAAIERRLAVGPPARASTPVAAAPPPPPHKLVLLRAPRAS